MKEKEIYAYKISKENVKIIGAELKRRRKIQSKTLVTLNTNCSVSYISKIENGKIIPKVNILNDLCAEHGISKEELDKLLRVDELIEECLIALFWNNKDKITEVYNLVYSFDNYKVNLIKAMYEMIYYHWDSVEIYLATLESIKENLEEKTEYVFYYLCMCYKNAMCNYPVVYDLYKKLDYCKNNYINALASKEMFIAVAKYGIEYPIFHYEDYLEKYKNLFNYNTTDMYELLVDTLINSKFQLQETIKNELNTSKKIQYLLANLAFDELEEILSSYSPNQLEKLLIATAKGDFSNGEKIYKKLQLNRLSAKDVIIANYCNHINKGNDEALADFIIQVAAPYALQINDGILFKMFLKKLSTIAFSVGKYKAVASMNLTYFDMLEKGRTCLL